MPEVNLSYGDRKQTFLEAVREDPAFGNGWRLTENFGQSNKSRIMDAGIFLCNANLEGNHNEDYNGHVFASVVGLPPQDEFWFAVFVQSELDDRLERLRFMKE